MAKVMTLFIMMLCINIMIVLNGYTIASSSLITSLFGGSEGAISGNSSLDASTVFAGNISGDASGILNPQNQGNTNLLGWFDPIWATIKFVGNFVGSLFIAPLLIGFALGFPTWAFSILCIVPTVAFWISGILFIRGVN